MILFGAYRKKMRRHPYLEWIYIQESDPDNFNRFAGYGINFKYFRRTPIVLYNEYHNGRYYTLWFSTVVLP